MAAAMWMLVVNASGCGKSSDNSSAGSMNEANTAGAAGSGGDQGNVALGQAALTTRNCTSCHGANLAGADAPYMGTMATYPANITPDKDTGIGDWDNATIVKAIMTGVDDEDMDLCPTMPHFSTMNMTMTEAQSIAAYLKSVPAVNHEVKDSSCPPTK
jgi:mono/diheme cytochrome c family protein